MPRPLRLQFENAWYHVMNRGAGFQIIYKSIIQRNLFLELLANATKLFSIEIHAYCLMDNHFHLLIKTPRANLDQAMHYISGTYTKCFNQMESTDGPLFRSRYKAILVDYDGYLLQVSRYIHLNPLKAKIVKHAEEYHWSSYNYYLQEKNKPYWLNTDEILSMFSDTANFYRNFVETEDIYTERFYSKKNVPVIFGSKEFKKKITSNIENNHSAITDLNKIKDFPTIDQITKHCADSFGVSQNEFYKNHRGKTNLPREVAIYICRTCTAEKPSTIAKKYNCSSGNISNLVKKILRSINTYPEFKEKINQIQLAILKGA